MKNLKIFVFSAFLASTLSFASEIECMEDFLRQDQTPSATSSPLPLSYTYPSLPSFLEDSPLYHQVSMERYRAAVHTLRQEIADLHKSLALSGDISELASVENTITDLNTKLSYHTQALSQYGTDREAALIIIQKEIQEYQANLKKMQADAENNPHLKGLNTAQLENFEKSLIERQQYLTALEESEAALIQKIRTAKGYLANLKEKETASLRPKQKINQKIDILNGLYAEHVKTPCSQIIFCESFPKYVLESLGLPLQNLRYLNRDSLFQLFARSLEMPYVPPFKTLEQNKAAYKSQLITLITTLANRLGEEGLALELSTAIPFSTEKFPLDFGEAGKALEKMVVSRKEASLNALVRKHDLELLQDILYQACQFPKNTSASLLAHILDCSPHGLLGLCITSLDHCVLTSWNNPAKTASYLRIQKGVSSPEALSRVVLEVTYNILGLHLNKAVLEKVLEDLDIVETNPDEKTYF